MTVTDQLGLESVLQLEPQVVGLKHCWTGSSRPHAHRPRAPHAPGHPHHGGVAGRRHPLWSHMSRHGGVVKAAVRRHSAAAVALAVQQRLHGAQVGGGQVLILLRQRTLKTNAGQHIGQVSFKLEKLRLKHHLVYVCTKKLKHSSIHPSIFNHFFLRSGSEGSAGADPSWAKAL